LWIRYKVRTEVKVEGGRKVEVKVEGEKKG
jgi:hypothetical protein